MKEREENDCLLPYRDKSLKDRPGETWAPIPRLEKYYLISTHGRVKRLERACKNAVGWASVLKEQIMLPALNRTYNKYRQDPSVCFSDGM